MEDGYRTKFEVKLVKADDNFPNGIRCSLTLHDRRNQRIVGFDNAMGLSRQGDDSQEENQHGITNMTEKCFWPMSSNRLGS